MDSATITDNRFAYDVTRERSNRLEDVWSEESNINGRDSESETTIDDDHADDTDDSDDSDDEENVKNISPE